MTKLYSELYDARPAAAILPTSLKPKSRSCTRR